MLCEADTAHQVTEPEATPLTPQELHQQVPVDATASIKVSFRDGSIPYTDMPAFLAQDYTLLRTVDHLVMALKREVLVSLLLTHRSVEYPHTYAHRNARYMGSHHLGLYQEAGAGREGKVKLVGRCHGRFSDIEERLGRVGGLLMWEGVCLLAKCISWGLVRLYLR